MTRKTAWGRGRMEVYGRGNSGEDGMEGAQSGKESEGVREPAASGGTRRCVGPGQTSLTKWRCRSCQGLERVPTQQARIRINRHHTFHGPPTFFPRSWAADWLSEVQGDTDVKVGPVPVRVSMDGWIMTERIAIRMLMEDDGGEARLELSNC